MSVEHKPALSARSLSVSYRSGGVERNALDGVNLDLARGETLAVVGESGSGKSTLALTLLGLLPRGACGIRGEIHLEHCDLDASKPQEWSRLRGTSLAFVPQDTLGVFDPLLEIGAQVAEPLIARGMSREHARRRALELLIEVGLEDAAGLMSVLPERLSGGQRQRAAIAAALALDPGILIADEPTSALDPVHAREVIDLLDRLRRSRGLGLLWISHDLRAVALRADRIVVLCEGRVVESGVAREVLARPAHAHTRALVNSLVDARPAGEIPAVAPEARNVLEVRALWARPRRRGSFERERDQVFELGDVQFELRAGEVTALIGRSGSGKSTVMRALLGLEPTARGVVKVSRDGRTSEVLGAGSAQLASARRSIGWIPQDPGASLDPRATLIESISEPLLQLGRKSTVDARARALELLDACGLDRELALRLPHQLSGGERQRGAIARALAQDPRALLLDEPTSSLDATVALRIVELVGDLVRARGLCALWVTHDVELARRVAQRVLVIENGRIAERGEAQPTLRNPASEAARALVHAADQTLTA